SAGNRSWAPRVSISRNTCKITAIRLVVEDPLAATTIWTSSSLPHDCQNLIPVPNESGCLVAASNSLTFASAIPSELYTMALNGFATTSCDADRRHPLHDINARPVALAQQQKEASLFDDDDTEKVNLAVNLEAASFVFSSNRVLIAALNSGALLQ